MPTADEEAEADAILERVADTGRTGPLALHPGAGWPLTGITVAAVLDAAAELLEP